MHPSHSGIRWMTQAIGDVGTRRDQLVTDKPTDRSPIRGATSSNFQHSSHQALRVCQNRAHTFCFDASAAPAGARHRPSDGSMAGHRLRRWPAIDPALGRCLLTRHSRSHPGACFFLIDWWFFWFMNFFFADSETVLPSRALHHMVAATPGRQSFLCFFSSTLSLFCCSLAASSGLPFLPCFAFGHSYIWAAFSPLRFSCILGCIRYCRSSSSALC